ncbi:hypothetical protein C8Z91_11365 [Paenibacillus elgii]|uniref:Uncharacterized protein n=1 Tax=Paenibacillus elgii TaxID=189691 RepID=A0A2T6G4I0_9BACL|nr:hypothetical protein C8Z91_11365 [Paenibacillus elgii]
MYHNNYLVNIDRVGIVHNSRADASGYRMDSDSSWMSPAWKELDAKRQEAEQAGRLPGQPAQ